MCSNGWCARLWKTELQRLADDTGLTVSVCHRPPGTSKWKKIEHRLFAYISQNWRGRPLISFEVIVNPIADTTTATGLKIQAELDTNAYPKGRKVWHSDKKPCWRSIERQSGGIDQRLLAKSWEPFPNVSPSCPVSTATVSLGPNSPDKIRRASGFSKAC